jgi:hypothetical protein
MEKKHILGECSGCKGAGMKKPFVLEPGGPPRPADKYDAPRLMADKAPFKFQGTLKQLHFKNLPGEQPAFAGSPDDD